jgi:hypothetical protein
MNKISLENILLFLIVIYVLYNFYKCYMVNYKQTMLEKFNNEMINISKNMEEIDKLKNLKPEEKLDILFTLYINILKIISTIMINVSPILESGVLNDSLLLLNDDIYKIVNNKKFTDIIDIEKILNHEKIIKLKELFTDESLKEILGIDLYKRNIELYHRIFNLLSKYYPDNYNTNNNNTNNNNNYNNDVKYIDMKSIDIKSIK